MHLGPMSMDWLRVDCLGNQVACRPSWDSSAALLSLDTSCCFYKVPLPASS